MDMLIIPLDKGSAVVVLSEDNYIREANWQLNTKSYYQKLPANLTSQPMSEIKIFADSMFNRGLIDKKSEIS